MIRSVELDHVEEALNEVIAQIMLLQEHRITPSESMLARWWSRLDTARLKLFEAGILPQPKYPSPCPPESYFGSTGE